MWYTQKLLRVRVLVCVRVYEWDEIVLSWQIARINMVEMVEISSFSNWLIQAWIEFLRAVSIVVLNQLHSHSETQHRIHFQGKLSLLQKITVQSLDSTGKSGYLISVKPFVMTIDMNKTYWPLYYSNMVYYLHFSVTYNLHSICSQKKYVDKLHPICHWWWPNNFNWFTFYFNSL